MIKKSEYHIFKYMEAILDFERELINSYKLNDIPYNEQNKFPKSGVVKVNGIEVPYLFHGNGCTFKNGRIEIGYHVYPDRENYITTGPFEFMQFLNSFDSRNQIEQKEVLKCLNELSTRGILKKIFEDYFVYEINLEWHRNIKS